MSGDGADPRGDARPGGATEPDDDRDEPRRARRPSDVSDASDPDEASDASRAERAADANDANDVGGGADPATRGSKRRVALLILAAAVAAVVFTLAPRWPKDQVVRIILGDAAPRVEEVRVRYADAHAAAQASGGDGRAEDWTREVDFRYPKGEAPRIVTHEPRLPDGDYVVEIDLVTATDQRTARRRVALQGGATSIDVSEAVGR